MSTSDQKSDQTTPRQTLIETNLNSPLRTSVSAKQDCECLDATTNNTGLNQSDISFSSSTSPFSPDKADEQKACKDNSRPMPPSKANTSINSNDFCHKYVPRINFQKNEKSLDDQLKQQLEFAQIESESHQCKAQYPNKETVLVVPEDCPPYLTTFTTYFSFIILIIFGHVRDFFGRIFRSQEYSYLRTCNGLAPLFSDFDSFYLRRLKLRINDAFHRPTTGVPGRTILLLDRVSHDQNKTWEFVGTTTLCMNLASYNYLGFAQSKGPCTDDVITTMRQYGLSMGASINEGGYHTLQTELEAEFAKFIGKPECLIFSQGFGTNATLFASIAGRQDLIISDELNHASIRFGSRASKCTLRIFRHNDVASLESVLRECISQGQPRTHRPWRKIFVLVEGLYSMDGDFVDLPGIVELRKKYKFYLFVDEAHSIGAIGPNSKGVCDYYGINPADIDILMGTFTKSFGANGGYVASDPEVIAQMRMRNAGCLFAEAMSPVVLQQIKTSLNAIQGKSGPEGPKRVRRLAFNSRYLRAGLKRLGFIIYGSDDSPVIPLMLYNPGKLHAFSHEMLRRNVAVVIVGYPATPLLTSRARFCVSASHSKSDLDQILRICDEVGTLMGLKISSGLGGYNVGIKQIEYLKNLKSIKVEAPRWPLEKVIKETEEDVQS